MPQSPTRAWKLIGKRLIDIVVASLSLVALGPMFLGIALWIKVDSRGPVFFLQRRVGRWGRPFICLKFRTMHPDAEGQLMREPELFRVYLTNAFKLPAHRDPRITRAGRVLRRTSLDELPQIANVLLGHMSLVGPRPVLPNELTLYEPNASLLLSMRPGMTGAWAVSGRSKVGYPARARIELEYVGRWSLRTDARIILKTIPVVVSADGAH
jgi:lipopolysaccharide/colanic/teichoic acid biosynthesis glycosyltransferase